MCIEVKDLQSIHKGILVSTRLSILHVASTKEHLPVMSAKENLLHAHEGYILYTQVYVWCLYSIEVKAHFQKNITLAIPDTTAMICNDYHIYTTS